MSWVKFIEALNDKTKVHAKAWLIVYTISIITPFAYILLLSLNRASREPSLPIDLLLTGVGLYCVLATFRAILQMFQTAIGTHELTGEKIARLILTYLYMLLAFAGIYLVLYFDSDLRLIRLETALTAAGSAQTPLPALAFAGVGERFWSGPEMEIQWRNLLLIYLDMVYFSATTITTLGFGDIVAKLPFVKILVALEALFGNLLLVLGVASIVPRKER